MVKTARNCLAWSPADVMKLYVVLVAPSILDQLSPLGLLCHCTVGVGVPLAAAVNVAVAPATTVVLAGWVVTAGAEFTVSVAALVVAVPAEFVNTARYCLPLSPAAVVKL